MKRFRFIIASLLALVLLLNPALSYANSATLPTGFQMPSVGDVAKRIVSRSNVVNYAVVGLLGAVDWVLDPENNQVKYNIKPNEDKQKYPEGYWTSEYFRHLKASSADGISQLIANEIAANKGYTIHTAKGVLINFRSGNAAYTFTDSNGVYRGEESYPYHMVSIHLVDTRDFSNETYDKLSYEQVAEQIIKNAKAGHAESVDFVVEVANEIALLSQHGKNDVADSGIVKDYNAETNNGKTQDRCEWLKANKHRYSAERVKDTEKAWKCRHSRQSKDKK